MDPIYFTLLSALLWASSSEAANCENGWSVYKDELCIKVFNTYNNYEEAKYFCSSKGDEMAKASLVTVKDSEMQQLLANHTHGLNDNVWLGSQYDHETGQFKWVDGDPLNYTNWQEGYPRDANGQQVCIEFRPSNSKTTGKWADVSCLKRNLVICQKQASCTLKDELVKIIELEKRLQEEIDAVNRKLDKATNERHELREQLFKTDGDLQNTRKDLQTTKQELSAARQDIATVSARVVPVGSIYIEYHNQPSPRSLWPGLTWADVSSTYTGLFFRVSGTGSGSWGATQTACAPRITQMQNQERTTTEYSNTISVPTSGWSQYVDAGKNVWSSSRYYEGLRFHTENCEIRPRNQAIRIWKRMA